jgi:hypothetical protein
MSYTQTKLEKDRERRRRDEAEKEKKRKEEEEKKKKTKPPTPAEKYGGERVLVASPRLLTFLSPRTGKALCKYAWRGNVKRCTRCVRKGASVEFANPISMSRPLHRAALGGSLETVTWLVKEKKVMLNTCDDEEWRPLHFAASKVRVFFCCFFVVLLLTRV